MFPPEDEIVRAKKVLGPQGGEWLLEFARLQSQKYQGIEVDEARFEELTRLVTPFLEVEHHRVVRSGVYPEKCPTCGEPYIKHSTVETLTRGMFCSNGFHSCRDCVWYNGQRLEMCSDCEVAEQVAKADWEARHRTK